MKVLITGGNGRIGKKLLNRLAGKYETMVTSIEDLSVADNLKSISYFKADLTQEADIELLLRKAKPDAIVHLAGIMGPVCEQDHDLAYKINVEATRMLAKASAKRGVKRFIFASSSAVYPQNKSILTEKDASPQSYYGRTKLMAESKLNKIAVDDGIEIVILRIFNVYGETFHDSFINKIEESIQTKTELNILGPDNFARDYIHIDDLVDVIEKAIECDPMEKLTIMNVGSGKCLTNQDLLDKVKQSKLDLKYNIVPIKESSIVCANINVLQKTLRKTKFREVSFY